MMTTWQKTALASVIALAPGMAYSASFQLQEQSAAHLGKAFAGTASDITDASTVYFNPAGMSQLKGDNFSTGVVVIGTDAEFSNNGSSYNGPNSTTDDTGVIPNIYAAFALSDKFSLGLGVNAPFGLSSGFGDQWVGRYSATHSKVEVINANINASWAINDKIALGLGVDYQKMTVTLKNQVDSTLGFAPNPSTDSSAKIEGDDDDFVLDFSLLLTPTDGTSIGFLWRQGGSFDLTGDAEFTLNDACTPGTGYPTGAAPAPTTGTLCAGALGQRTGAIRSSNDLPDTYTLSLSQTLTPEWAIHADIAQTQWSSMQTIAVINTDHNVTVDELDLRYDDTMRYALGTTFKPGGGWTWRAGIAKDQAPQTAPQYVSPRIPDADRQWLTLGANIALSNTLSIDVSYAHLWVDDVSLVDTDDTSGRQLIGGFNSKVDIVGAQLNWHF